MGVSQTDSFISEVTEEVRRDRLYGLLRRWGWLLVLLVVGLIGAAAWYEISKSRAETASRARGDALRAALATPDPAARTQALLALPDGPAEPVQRFAAAGAALQAGDASAAAAALAALAGDGATPQPWRDLAALQRVMILGPELPASERLAVLDGLAAEGAPFRGLALEQRALMRLETGDRAQALADLDAILADPTAPQGLRARTEQMRIAAGGEAAAPVTAPASGG